MEKFLVFLAQGLGSGLAKKAPGTWGCLVAVILAWFITPSLLTIIIAAAVGVYICTVAAEALNDDDPSCVVFDEWVRDVDCPLGAAASSDLVCVGIRIVQTF